MAAPRLALRSTPDSCAALQPPLTCGAAWQQVASELEKEEGISGITMGRQVEERRTVAQASRTADAPLPSHS